MRYPILEYVPSRGASIEPSKIIAPQNMPEHCVICFFKEVIDKVVGQNTASVVAQSHWEDGLHPIYEISHHDQRLAFFHPGVGEPIAAGLLEEAIAFGCRKFIACGGAGGLTKE